MIITTILGSWWTDKIGRRRGILIYGLLIMFVAPAIYYYVINGVINGTLMVLLATAIIFAIAQFPVPVNVAYINERFPTKIRGLGYGIGYSLPVIIAGFFGFYQKTLSSIMPFKYTQLAILSFAGLLWFIGALIGPETKGIDLKELDKEA
jgi:MFS family permease